MPGFTIRNSTPYTTTWSAQHHRWLAEQAFDHPAQLMVLQELILATRHAKKRLPVESSGRGLWVRWGRWGRLQPGAVPAAPT